MRVLCFLFSISCVLTSCSEPAGNTFIAADNPDITYMGRFDFSDKKLPVFMYSGCAIRTVFEGTSLVLIMKDDSLRNMFNVIIDDSLSVITTDKKDSTYVLAKGLQNKKHSFEITRRTEWHGGNTTFMGLYIDQGKKIYRPEVKDRKIEFIGDSYTCGYGNEGKNRMEHFAYTTENNYLSFGAVTARALGAEYLMVCRSGIGMWQGYGGNKEFTMPRLYDEITAGNIKTWDYTQYQPQLVVIDLGGNDLSVALDSAGYVNTYIDFLTRIRKNYATAKIICVAGPSAPGAEWQVWRTYVHRVVELFGKNDSDTRYFEFSPFDPSGSDWHPNVEQHKRMADELIPFVKEVMEW